MEAAAPPASGRDHEQDTVAAAATGVAFPASGPPEPDLTVAADKPFLSLIHHRPSGLVLFAGQVTTPPKRGLRSNIPSNKRVDTGYHRASQLGLVSGQTPASALTTEVCGRVHHLRLEVAQTWWMAERVRVRRLSDVEGRQLQQIVRRGGKSDRSIVKWRRAMIVLASAGGNDVNAIARLVQTSPDRVREMIHRFNDLGMRSLDPQWAGGRLRQITTIDRELIVKTAKTRPTKLGLPFTHWSVRKLAGHLAARKGRKVRIGRERLRQILIAEGITFQRTKTWKESPDPLKEPKLARIETAAARKSWSRFRRILPVRSMPESVTVAESVPKHIATSYAIRFVGITGSIV